MCTCCNVNCVETEQNIDLNKTEIFSKKTSKSLGVIYKNDSPKSSPTLYNSITISNNDTNQSTIINTINNLKYNNIINNNQSTIICIDAQETDANNIFEHINNSTMLSVDRLTKQRGFGSPKDFKDYYNLHTYTPSELGLYGSLFKLWNSYWSKEVKQVSTFYSQYIEYILPKHLLKVMSYISELFNFIIHDAEYLKDNPYVVKYINKHLVNMDIKDPRIELFPEYRMIKYNKSYTDAITYVLYKEFSLLEDFLSSLDVAWKKCKSLKKIIKNNKNVNKEQVNVSKQTMKKRLYNYKDNFCAKNNKKKDIQKILDSYKQCFDSNNIIFNCIQEKMNKYTSMKNNKKYESKMQEIDAKLTKYNNEQTIIVDQIQEITNEINKYTNELDMIKQELKVIKMEINKSYSEYCKIKENMIDTDLVIEHINNNLENYFDKKDQLDNELNNIYNNNKLLNPLRLNIIKKNNNKTVPNNIDEIYNELKLQKDNINNYIEILKDVMKNLFKVEKNK